MAKNFYFRTDAEVVSGSANFSRLVSANYAAYSLTEQQAEEYALLDAELQAAWVASTNPATRTTVAVAGKNVAKQRVQQAAVLLSRIIAATKTVEDADLITLGLLPRATYARRKLSTSTQPRVHVLSVVGRVATIRIRAGEGDDAADGTGRLPRGALGAQVYVFVGEEPPSHARQYDHVGLATRETYAIVFPNDVPSGATAHVSAAWVGKRNAVGRACPPVRLTVQGGPVLASTGTLAA